MVRRGKNIEQDYILEDEIGRGKFGSVRLCKSKANGEEFACKTFCKSIETTQLHLTKLEGTEKDCKNEDILAAIVYREVEILHHLSGHPGIVTLKGVYHDEEEENFYIIMELCSGGDLLTQMKKTKCYSEIQAAFILKELMLVVKYCHDKGVVHRDIKAENVLLTSSGKIKLADFGLATRICNGQTMSAFCGSPSYMAPEVLEGNYTEKVDIWSAGVLLYGLLVGVLPFKIEGNSLGEISKQHKKIVELDFREEISQSLSEPARDLIRKMLSKDVSSRLSARQVLTHPWILSQTNRINEIDRGLIDSISVAMSKVKIPHKRRGGGGSSR
ncbi:hypothetical protein ACHQM5_004831 [Ranunculus cassubicifolius]